MTEPLKLKSVRFTAETMYAEAAEFTADLETLQRDVRGLRNDATEAAKSELRFVGERIERALQELRRIKPLDRTQKPV
jgi:hypothetical protein